MEKVKLHEMKKERVDFLITLIYLANFEVFRWSISLNINLLFLKECATRYITTKKLVVGGK